ncbi:hypothetical protein MKK88_22565 [Methylobacterium sp. E-005]|uniref:hypothetical protein n=1 Tax=Methylobacterium sp. E-005 TaxID=2836549 RepID=UPI001FB91F78|nr:hypothetical protein [Methylobacterium sp. E-005]MCJ2088741.1 hypothetical protein [Methylobacterium sp. E-005]
MSMEAIAFCTRPLSDVAEWQAALEAVGFDMTLDVDRIPPDSTGYLPATWQGREVGFECSVIPLSDLTETYPEIDFGGPWACIYDFYFSTFPGCAGAWMAVAACVNRSGGIAFDPQDSSLIVAQDAIRYAQKALVSLLREEASLRNPPAG